VSVYIWCSVAMLFTNTLVLSCPVGKGGFERETWAVGVNCKILGGPKQIRWMLMEESSKILSLTLDWGHERRIREVLKEDGHSSMYKLWLHNYAVERNCHELFVACYPWLIIVIPCSQARLAILINVYFSKVKNKPWLPWVYSWTSPPHIVHFTLSTVSNSGTLASNWQNALSPKYNDDISSKTLAFWVTDWELWCENVA
jgi:hypothetical protein